MSSRDVLGESGKNIIKAYSKEIYLWENPFDAPEVPPESFWKKFFKNAGKIEADMPGISEQIEKKVNCRRAAMKLKAKDDPLFQEIFGKMKDSSAAVEESEKKYESSSENDSDLLSRFKKVFVFPRKGDIFYTQSKLPVVDENGGTSFIYTFKPCAVLLLDDGEKMPWNDKVFRCAVVTPDCMGKAVEGQDMDLKNGWILHKWLSYPVSIYQLDCTKKAETIKNIDEIAEIVEEYSVLDEGMTRYGKDEKRLMAMAEYVPVAADTRFAAFEMAEEAGESLVSRVENWLSKFTAKWVENLGLYTQPAGFAAADEDSSVMVIRKGDETDSKSFTAHLTDPIFLRKDAMEKSLPEWNFDSNEADIPEGMVFVLRDKKGNSIGFGSVYHATGHGVAQLIEYFPEKLENDISSANDVVLEVYIPW